MVAGAALEVFGRGGLKLPTRGLKSLKIAVFMGPDALDLGLWPPLPFPWRHLCVVESTKLSKRVSFSESSFAKTRKGGWKKLPKKMSDEILKLSNGILHSNNSLPNWCELALFFQTI